MNQNRNKKVLCLLLDAAEPSLVARWMAEGRMPNMARLYREGSSRMLMSSSDLSSPATYGAFRFGQTPERHGTGFNHRQLKRGTYEIRKKYAEDTPGLPFWKYFPGGTRSILFDIPNTYVDEESNAVQVIGWGEEGLSARAGSYPRNLFRTVNRRFGRHPLHGWYHRRPRNLRGWLDLKDRVLEGIFRRQRAFRYLLERHPWDFAAVNFSETHFAGHLFWHHMNLGHPEHEPALAVHLQHAIREVYESVDRAVGMIMRNEPDAYVCVFSNTGMGPNYSGRHLVPEILERLGWGGPGGRSAGSAVARALLPSRRWGYAAVERLEDGLGAPLISRVKRLFPERMWDFWTRRFVFSGNRWPKSRAFAIPTDYCGGIRINLQGREPQGTVPRQDYDRACAQLADSFARLVNIKTDRSAVECVIKTTQLVHGEVDHDFPDVLIRWRRDRSIEGLESDEVGQVFGVLPDKRSGAHTNNGLFVMKGPGIAAGERLADGDIMDIGPTFVHIMGGSLEDVDGKVMRDIIIQ